MEQKIVIGPTRIGQVLPTTTPPVTVKQTGVGNSGVGFDRVFQKQLDAADEIKFSAHALKRLESRQIVLNHRDLTLLKDAVNRAEAKGAKESLILMDRLALVVSVKNRTVITAVDDHNLTDNIFTNIDSAVIVRQ
jgi:flagellar operon protein